MRDRATLLLLCFLLLSFSSADAETWIPLEPGARPAPVSIVTVSSTFEGVTFDIEASGFFASASSTAGGTFVRLEIPGCGETTRIGQALLPVLRRAVEIPQGSTPELEILDRETVRLSLAELGLPATVYPVQEPVEKIPGARESARFAIDEAFYASSATYPAFSARIAETGQLRAHRFAMLEVAPVTYLPADGTVEITRRLRVRMTHPGADLEKTRTVLERYASPTFDAAAGAAWIEPSVLMTKAAPALPVGYVIITAPAYYDQVQPLAEWKHAKGYHTTVTRTTDIPGGATTAAIKSYLLDLWENAEVPPSFVLLVGDVADIPNWTGTATNNPATDLYYSTMTAGDYIPDLAVGRFSVVSSAQASNLVERTVEYEKHLFPADDWLERAVFMASQDNYSVTEATHNYCISTYMNPAGYTSDKLYCHTYGATTQQVRDALNAGRGLTVYSGHGSTTSWADGPPFSQSDVNGLTNLDRYPFVESYACYTGDFVTAECFAETWIRATGKGSVGFWGSSVTSYWTEDDVLEKGAFRSLFTDGITWAGGFTNQGKWYLYEQYSGGGSAQRYFEMYNLFGDPSLELWTDVPATMAVTHAGTCPLGAGSYSVHVTDGSGPVAGALVCLDGPGGVFAAAYTGSDGNADLALDPAPLEVGSMDLTVTRHNAVPVFDAVEILVPAVVTLDPDTILVETPTPVTVTVLDTLSHPMANVVVTMDGWGLDPPLADTTDASGRAVIAVDAPYGEVLTVVGRQIGETYDCFEKPLAVVGAVPLPSPRVEARVDELGLLGALAPYYEGTVAGEVAHAGVDLFAAGCGVDTMTSSPTGGAELRVTPDDLGRVTVALASPGYIVHEEDVPVIEVYGTLSGVVRDASTSALLVGVPIAVYTAGADTSVATPVFEAVSAGGGSYASPDSVAAGPYDVYASEFGYLDFAAETMVYWGANTLDIPLAPAPSGVVSGTVTEEGSGRPISATLKIYRSDDLSLYAETSSDSLAGGAFATGPLPWSTYVFRVSAFHFMTRSLSVTVDEASETLNVDIQPTEGNLLVIDDDTGDKDTAPKLGQKGRVLAFDGTDGDEVSVKSATTLAQDLASLGYDVTTESSAATNAALWPDYDVVVWSSGDDTSPVADTARRSSLNAYVAGHGKLLIEGGEIGYDAASYPGYPHFADSTLHVTDWEHDSSGNLTLEDPIHPLATIPNALPATLAMTYSGYGDQDALVPSEESHLVFDWSSYNGQGGILVYDDDPDPAASQVVFYAFDYSDVTDLTGRKGLLENTIAHLLAAESAPEGSISGRVRLHGETSHGGVTVTTRPLGRSAVTNAAGEFVIADLYDGLYEVTARKEGFADSTVSVLIAGGAAAENVDFLLAPVYEYMAYPERAIPDNSSTGIRVTIPVPDDVEITGVDCYVDITHSYRGDLVVELTSPAGTKVRLHNRTGSSSDDLIAWYDLDTACDGPGTMQDFAGESALGAWELYVSDQASYDTGTLHAWGLRIAAPLLAGAEVETAGGIPDARFLSAPCPNPFNPATCVRFGLPRAEGVEVAVFNIQGQRVRTLASGECGAGVHALTWDGRDSRGSPVASGVYFCRMACAGFTETRRMVLMR